MDRRGLTRGTRWKPNYVARFLSLKLTSEKPLLQLSENSNAHNTNVDEDVYQIGKARFTI